MISTIQPRRTCLYELARHPAQLWFDLHDSEEQAGLAVLSRSTKDYEVLAGKRHGHACHGSTTRPVPLRIPCDNRLWMEYPGDESSQSLGCLTHHYALLPHTRTWSDDAIYRDAVAFNQPLKPVQFAPQAGTLPPTFSLLEIEDPNVVLSAVLKAEDRESLLVRVFNPTDHDIKTQVSLGFTPSGVYKTSLAGEKTEALACQNDQVAVTVSEGHILTIELER